MTKDFFPIKNFEARVFVADPESLREKLLKLGARKIKDSHFTDYIFEPKGKRWNLKERSFKLRVFKDKKGKEIAEFRYHPSVFEGGVKKNTLFLDALVGKKEDALKILKDWNFRELFHFSRTSEVYEVGDQLITLENIEKLGWMMEIEGDSRREVEKLMVQLGIFDNRVEKTLPELVKNK